MNYPSRASLGALAGILFFVGIIWFARPNETPRPDANTAAITEAITTTTLRTPETRYDFGPISMAKGKVSHAFVLQNTAETPVVIEKVYSSCMCTSATLAIGEKILGPFGMPGHGVVPSIRETLAASSTAAVTVTFDPAAHGPSGIGRIERAVRIENSAGAPLELQIAATVTP